MFSSRSYFRPVEQLSKTDYAQIQDLNVKNVNVTPKFLLSGTVQTDVACCEFFHNLFLFFFSFCFRLLVGQTLPISHVYHSPRASKNIHIKQIYLSLL